MQQDNNIAAVKEAEDPISVPICIYPYLIDTIVNVLEELSRNPFKANNCLQYKVYFFLDTIGLFFIELPKVILIDSKFPVFLIRQR